MYMCSQLFSCVRLFGLFVTLWTVAPQIPCPWDSPGKNIGVGCHFLLQGTFLIQGSNPGLQHCRQILYQLSTIDAQLKYGKRKGQDIKILLLNQRLFSPRSQVRFYQG